MRVLDLFSGIGGFSLGLVSIATTAGRCECNSPESPDSSMRGTRASCVELFEFLKQLPIGFLPMKENNEMADFDLSKITGREPPLVTDDERDAEIAYLSDVVANRDRELAALRARVAELEADAERLNWLQANPRLSTIRLAGEPDRECYMYAVAGAPGLKLREIIDAARGLPANKTEVPK